MNIYKISHNTWMYDVLLGAVIVANNVKEVRHLAKEESGDEGVLIWESAPIELLGKYTGEEEYPFVVLMDTMQG